MYKVFALPLIAFALLTACQNTPALMSPLASANVQAASNPKALNPNDTSDPRYSFRKPTAVLTIDPYTSSDWDTIQVHLKTFFAKYVDKNDIFNYQIIKVSNADLYNVNIYGGNQEFVMNRILPDLRFYLEQRMRFDKISYTKGY